MSSNSINTDVKFRISIQNKIDKRLLKSELNDMGISVVNDCSCYNRWKNQ